MSDPSVVFEKLHDDARPPRRATGGSAGYDLRAYLRGRRVRVVGGARDELREVAPEGEPPELRLAPGERALVPTGFRARLPAGCEAQIRIRSSLAFRRGLVLPNAPGTIDSDYPDEWFVLVQNASDRDRSIAHGERIAQAVLTRYETLPWREGTVDATTDREGGLGSTGSGRGEDG